MDQSNEEQFIEPLSSIEALPIELLVYMLSFLKNVREAVKIRYVSRRFRRASETPSLWRNFVWPHFDASEERCLKGLFKSCGPYVQRLSFPDHVTPSKLMIMLRRCVNLVKLCIPTIPLNLNQLVKTIQPMEKLQSLDMPLARATEIDQVLINCARLEELTVRVIQTDVHDSCELIFTDCEWAKRACIPQSMNVVSSIRCLKLIQDRRASTQQLRSQWENLNATTSIDHIGYFRIYCCSKFPIDLFPILPELQLQLGPSCTLPLVSASKYGLLGLEEDLLLLTDTPTNDKKTFHKATVLYSGSQDASQLNYLNHGITNLQHITHFSALRCHLLSGHLEQLALACPNLLELDLFDNVDCLKSLQGLYMISENCKGLQGLNLSKVSDVESHVRLWKILANLKKLTYLSIELCALMPCGKSKNTMDKIISLYHQCLSLKALQFAKLCENCTRYCAHKQLSVLSSFPSLVHVKTSIRNHPTAIQDILGGCKNLKYFNYDSHSADASNSFAVTSSLEQLSVSSISTKRMPSSFMESISAHGGLVHVAIFIYSLTSDDIHTLIRNSPKLLTCQIYGQHIYDSWKIPVNLFEFKVALKKEFSGRKLFTCGRYTLIRKCYREYKTMCLDFDSLWPSSSEYRFW